MRLVQVYNTFEGSKFTGGFPTFRSLVDYLNKSLIVHSANYDVVIYTDSNGYDKIKDELPANTIFEIIEFEYIRDSYWNVGKLQVHALQTEPYLMIDLDATLNDVITELDTDVKCELLRGGSYGYNNHLFDLKPLKSIRIPCSGLLGFKDPIFAKTYAESAIDKIKNAKTHLVSFSCLWHIEEVYLGNLIEDNNLTISEFIDFEHLYSTKK